VKHTAVTEPTCKVPRPQQRVQFNLLSNVSLSLRCWLFNLQYFNYPGLGTPRGGGILIVKFRKIVLIESQISTVCCHALYDRKGR